MAGVPPDNLIADLTELGGAGMQVVELGEGASMPVSGVGVVRVGVHRAGPLPALDPEPFDILISTAPNAQAPWVSIPTIYSLSPTRFSCWGEGRKL